MPSTARPPRRWPRRSPTSTPTPTRPWRSCSARAARSARAPTSRRWAARDGNRTEPDGAGPMGPTRMRLSKPVIAAVAGHAVAGGLELALWCDLRVAEEDAVLGVFCRRWGVPLIDGGTVRLPQVIGLGRALDMILTGRAGPRPGGPARWAWSTGWSRPGSAREAAEQLAREIAALPQACLRSDRAVRARRALARPRRGDGQRVQPWHGGAGRPRRR